MNFVFRCLNRATEVIGYKFGRKNAKKIFLKFEKNDFYGDSSCFLIPPNDFSGPNYPRNPLFSEKYCIFRKSTLSSRILNIFIFMKSYLEMLSFGVNSFSVNGMRKSFDDVVDSIGRVIDDKTETT